MWPFTKKNWEANAVDMDAQQIRSLFAQEYDFHDIKFNDDKYTAIPYETLSKLAWSGKEDFQDYSEEKMDCDDFAMGYVVDCKREWSKKSKKDRALALGRANVVRKNGSIHALAVQVDNMNTINWIEIQSHSLAEEPMKILWVEI